MISFKEILTESPYRENIIEVLKKLKKHKLLTGPVIGSAAYVLLSGDMSAYVDDIDILGKPPKEPKPPIDNIEAGYITWFYKYPNDAGTLSFEYVADLKFNGKKMKLTEKPMKIKGIEVVHPIDWVNSELGNKKTEGNKDRLARLKLIRKKYKV